MRSYSKSHHPQCPEARQLELISWQMARSAGLRPIPAGSGIRFDTMPAARYTFHINVPARFEHNSEGTGQCLDRRSNHAQGSRTGGILPLLIEAKSAGDFTNVNKPEKRRGDKDRPAGNIRGQGGSWLFLCGYFDSGYLGYEAAEGIDWVWEHRIDDLRWLWTIRDHYGRVTRRRKRARGSGWL